MSQSPYARSLAREAAQSTIGGALIWLLTSTVAGLIPTVAAQGMDDVSWIWVLAWLGHLAVAGMALWGLLVVAIHAGCLSALIHGTHRLLPIVAITFVSQLTASSIVIVMLNDDVLQRVLLVWLACVIPATTYLVRSFGAGKRG